MIFRSFLPGDLDALEVLEARSFPVGPYTRNMLRKIFRMKESYSIIADDNGRIAAYIIVLPLDKDSADVESIAVDPDYQKSGLGTILMEKIEKVLVEHEFKVSILEVRDRNTAAINFYKKIGYEVVAHLPTYYHELYSGSRGAYRMRKELGS